MSDAITITVRPFRMGTDKEVALKPLEEAAEVFGEWQDMDNSRRNYQSMWAGYFRNMLADEIADCITACCNLADRYALDLQTALDRVEERNRERGRYPMAGEVDDGRP